MTPDSLRTLTTQFISDPISASQMCSLLTEIQWANALHLTWLKGFYVIGYIHLVYMQTDLSYQQQVTLIQLAQAL